MSKLIWAQKATVIDEEVAALKKKLKKKEYERQRKARREAGIPPIVKRSSDPISWKILPKESKDE